MPISKNITTEELMAMNYRYNYSDEELLKDWQRLCNISEFKLGSQFKPGMKLCQHFFPNFFEIENARGISFTDAWKDYEIMDKVRRWGLEGMSQLWLSWIRRAVYMTAGLPNSSFYRPHFARQIILSTGKPSGVLLDPCAGWAGRMLGTVSVPDWKYVGCEPNPETHDGIQRVINFINTDRATVFKQTAESFDHGDNQYDIVLTSPPYFNLEIYTSGLDQSYNKFSEYDVWLSQWLKPLIETSVSRLVDGGISAWNVMKTGKNDIPADVIDIHKSLGFELSETIGFNSPLVNIRKLKNKDVTWIFRSKTAGA